MPSDAIPKTTNTAVPEKGKIFGLSKEIILLAVLIAAIVDACLIILLKRKDF